MILYLDTSTEKCRVWLDEKYFEKILSRKMAQSTLRFIEDCLTGSRLNWENISGIVVFAGVGSFTGLRIGITIANTLADILEVPIIGISNSDFSPIDCIQNIDEWRILGRQKINIGENQKIAIPFYGKEANITKPRK